MINIESGYLADASGRKAQRCRVVPERKSRGCEGWTVGMRTRHSVSRLDFSRGQRSDAVAWMQVCWHVWVGADDDTDEVVANRSTEMGSTFITIWSSLGWTALAAVRMRTN